MADTNIKTENKLENVKEKIYVELLIVDGLFQSSPAYTAHQD